MPPLWTSPLDPRPVRPCTDPVSPRNTPQFFRCLLFLFNGRLDNYEICSKRYKIRYRVKASSSHDESYFDLSIVMRFNAKSAFNPGYTYFVQVNISYKGLSIVIRTFIYILLKFNE